MAAHSLLSMMSTEKNQRLRYFNCWGQESSEGKVFTHKPRSWVWLLSGISAGAVMWKPVLASISSAWQPWPSYMMFRASKASVLRGPDGNHHLWSSTFRSHVVPLPSATVTRPSSFRGRGMVPSSFNKWSV